MDRVMVEVQANPNSRRVIPQLPDNATLEKLAAMQREGATDALVLYLAQSRENIHRQMETAGTVANNDRALGACAALSDLIAILNDPRKLLELAKTSPRQ